MTSELEARSTSPIGGGCSSDHSVSVDDPKTPPTSSQDSRTKGPPSFSAMVASLILKRNNRKNLWRFRSTMMSKNAAGDSNVKEKEKPCLLCSPPTSPDYYRCRAHRAGPASASSVVVPPRVAAENGSIDAAPPRRVKLGLSRFCPQNKRVAAHHEP